MSVWVSKPVIKVLGGMAILFGIVTLISGGSALFVLHEIAEPAAKIVPFVLYFNFAAGFAYIVTGAGLITLRPWSPAFAAAIALATSVVFAGLGAWILAGNAYEVRTIVAMSLRAAFWWSVSAVSIVGSRSRAACKRNAMVCRPVIPFMMVSLIFVRQTTTKLLMNSLFEFATTAALRWTIGLAVAVGLSACASRPGTETLIVRQEPSKPYQAITVITATDRQRDPTGVGYTAARSSRLQFERFTVAVPVTHKSLGEARSQIQTDPLRKYTVMGRQDITFNGINADKDILIYVHGYNYSFQESLFQAAKVASDGKLSEMPILFSWPSEGSVTGYVADKDAAIYARDDLVQLLQDLKKRRTKSRVTLFGHSMGAWLVVEALRQLKISGQEDVLQRIDQVVLAAPDIDVDLFKRQVDTIGPLARPMIVLSSTDDRALVISSRMGGSRTRIGSLDATDASVQKMIASGIVKIVDLSALPALDRKNHNRFIQLINALSGSEIRRNSFLESSLSKRYKQRKHRDGRGLPPKTGEAVSKGVEGPRFR